MIEVACLVTKTLNQKYKIKQLSLPDSSSVFLPVISSVKSYSRWLQICIRRPRQFEFCFLPLVNNSYVISTYKWPKSENGKTNAPDRARL